MAYYTRYEDVDRIPNDLAVGDHVQIIRNCDNECNIREIVKIKDGKFILKDLPRFRFKREELCKMIYLKNYEGITGYALYYRWKKTGRDGVLISSKHSLINYKFSVYDWRGRKIVGPGPNRIKVEKSTHEVYLLSFLPRTIDGDN